MKTITNLLLGPQCLEFWSSMTPEIHQNDTQISLTCGASKKSQNDKFPTGNRLLSISKCQNFLGARSAPNFRRHRMSARHRRPNLLSPLRKYGREQSVGSLIYWFQRTYNSSSRVPKFEFQWSEFWFLGSQNSPRLPGYEFWFWAPQTVQSQETINEKWYDGPPEAIFWLHKCDFRGFLLTFHPEMLKMFAWRR